MIDSSPMRSSIVLATGIFDVLHYGHFRLFDFGHEKAQEIGADFVVGINSDESVRKIRELDPFHTQYQRIEMISSIDSVSYVVVFDETTPAALIETIAPSFYIKGGEYRLKAIPELAALNRAGGALLFFDCDFALHSTDAKRHL